jgi:hypothetical protein
VPKQLCDVLTMGWSSKDEGSHELLPARPLAGAFKRADEQVEFSIHGPRNGGARSVRGGILEVVSGPNPRTLCVLGAVGSFGGDGGAVAGALSAERL